jgi:hypothetical protein
MYDRYLKGYRHAIVQVTLEVDQDILSRMDQTIPTERSNDTQGARTWNDHELRH